MKIIQHSISINIPKGMTINQIIEILQHAKELTKDIKLTTTSDKVIFLSDEE